MVRVDSPRHGRVRVRVRVIITARLGPGFSIRVGRISRVRVSIKAVGF